VPEEPKATQAAKDLAEEQGVDLATVKGSGADGQITKEDVKGVLPSDEEQEPESESPEKLYYGILNPKVQTDRVALTDAQGNEFLLVADPVTGIVQGRVFSASELDELNKQKAPEGFKYLLKGREA